MVINKNDRQSVYNAFCNFMPCGVNIKANKKNIEIQHQRTVVSLPYFMLTMERFISIYREMRLSILESDFIDAETSNAIKNEVKNIENKLLIM